MRPPGDGRNDLFKGARQMAPDASRPKRAAGLSTPSAGLQESRVAADRVRERTAKLKKLRLDREAAEPAPAPTAPRRPAKSALNLARTQRTKKT